MSSVPLQLVSRQVFTHMNHCFRLFTGYLFFPLSILLALLFDACVSIPSYVHLQSRYSLISIPITLLLVACVLLACLALFELESVVVVSFTCTSMIAGLDVKQ